MICLSPPRMPWPMVGDRTTIPRTRPLYSVILYPSNENVVVVCTVPCILAPRGGRFVHSGISELRPNGSRLSCGAVVGRSGGRTTERQPDLTQVMFVMSGDLIKFIPQRAHAVYAMHELKMAAALIVRASIIDDCVANRFVYAPGDI